MCRTKCERWPGGGTSPTSRQLSAARVPKVSDDHTNERNSPSAADQQGDTQLDDSRELMEETRRRVAQVPAEVVVTNHVMGLYELAAIHLSADSPDLVQAALAIDALACLVEGLGDRIGPDAATMRDALANIRLAFVQIKSTHP
jgi:hypothetical protein